MWGQEIYLAGSSPEFGEWDPSRAKRMRNTIPGGWEFDCDIPSEKSFEYKYFLKDKDENIIWEGGKNRLLETGINNFDEIRCRDFWRTRRESDTALFSSAFTKVLLRRKNVLAATNTEPQFDKTLRIQIYVPRVSADCSVGILGDQPGLGNWMEEYTLKMNDEQFPLWHLDLDAEKLKFPFQFKYVVYDNEKKQVTTWEQGSNRLIRDFVCTGSRSIKIHTDENFRFPVSHWKGAGVAVPVFSLRTEKKRWHR